MLAVLAALLLSLPLPLPAAVSAQQQLPAAAAVEAALQVQQAKIDRLEARDQQQAVALQVQQAKIDWLEATADEHRAALHELQTETRHSGGHHGGSWATPQKRRSLATCNDTASSSSAQLSVEGVCSCTEDVVVGGRSVVDLFDQFNASLHLLQQQQQENTRVGEQRR